MAAQVSKLVINYEGLRACFRLGSNCEFGAKLLRSKSPTVRGDLLEALDMARGIPKEPLSVGHIISWWAGAIQGNEPALFKQSVAEFPNSFEYNGETVDVMSFGDSKEFVCSAFLAIAALAYFTGIEPDKTPFPEFNVQFLVEFRT